MNVQTAAPREIVIRHGLWIDNLGRVEYVTDYRKRFSAIVMHTLRFLTYNLLHSLNIVEGVQTFQTLFLLATYYSLRIGLVLC